MTTVRQLLRTVAFPLHPKSFISWHSFSYSKAVLSSSLSFDLSSLIVSHHCVATFPFGVSHSCVSPQKRMSLNYPNIYRLIFPKLYFAAKNSAKMSRERAYNILDKL